MYHPRTNLSYPPYFLGYISVIGLPQFHVDLCRYW